MPMEITVQARKACVTLALLLIVSTTAASSLFKTDKILCRDLLLKCKGAHGACLFLGAPATNAECDRNCQLQLMRRLGRSGITSVLSTNRGGALVIERI